MANGISTAAPAARGTGRESFSVSITPVDEKRFESEIRRLDTSGADEKKNREKFETRIEKAVFDLHDEMKDLRGEMKGMRGEMKDLRGEMKDLREEVRGEIKDLRGEMKDLRDEMSIRINRLDERLWWIFGVVVLSGLFPFGLKFF
jgi:predicted  nucleic acid-binding Zn-ribbon protein